MIRPNSEIGGWLSCSLCRVVGYFRRIISWKCLLLSRCVPFFCYSASSLTMCDMKTFSAFSWSCEPCLNPRLVSVMPRDSFRLSTCFSLRII